MSQLKRQMVRKYGFSIKELFASNVYFYTYSKYSIASQEKPKDQEMTPGTTVKELPKTKLSGYKRRKISEDSEIISEEEGHIKKGKSTKREK